MTSPQFPPDDGARPNLGVVVSLLDTGGGRCRVILDDVRSASPQRETTWSFDLFYTHKDLDSDAVNRMELSDDEYRDLGIALMARLIALMGKSQC
jgi:hypothetical protein